MDAEIVHRRGQVQGQNLPLQHRDMVLVEACLRAPAFRVVGVFNAVAPLPHPGKQNQPVGYGVLREPENHVAAFHRRKGLG